MKFTELEGVPKTLLKKKRVPFYKAFPFLKDDGEMKINENVDLLALTPKAAIEKWLMDIDPTEFTKHYVDVFNSMMSPDQLASNKDWTYSDFIMTCGSKDKPDEVTMHNLLVPFAVVLVSTEDLKTMDLLDAGDDYFQNDVVAITLKGKDIKIDLEELRFVSFKMKIDPKTGKKIISNVKLKEKE